MDEIAERIKEYLQDEESVKVEFYRQNTDCLYVFTEPQLLSLLEAVAREQRKSCGKSLEAGTRPRSEVFRTELVTDQLKQEVL